MLSAGFLLLALFFVISLRSYCCLISIFHFFSSRFCCWMLTRCLFALSHFHSWRCCLSWCYLIACTSSLWSIYYISEISFVHLLRHSIAIQPLTTYLYIIWLECVWLKKNLYASLHSPRIRFINDHTATLDTIKCIQLII